MQIRVIENNDNEGEKFSYILDVTPELAQEIQDWIEQEDELKGQFGKGILFKSLSKMQEKIMRNRTT